MTLEELRADTHFWLNTTSSEYHNTDLDRSINRWYFKVQSTIIDSMDNWTFNGEWAYTNLVKDQEEYLFPSDILTIKRVEARYTEGDNSWVKVNPVEFQAIRGTLSDESSVYSKTSPIYAKPDEKSLIIRPIPDADVVEGLRIWFTKEITELSADTDEPVFAENFHRILSLGAALDYIIANQVLEKRDLVKLELNELIDALRRFYSKRDKDIKSRIIPRMQNYL